MKNINKNSEFQDENNEEEEEEKKRYLNIMCVV